MSRSSQPFSAAIRTRTDQVCTLAAAALLRLLCVQVNADEFPGIREATASGKYSRPQPPVLTPENLRLVGFTQAEIQAGEYPYTASRGARL